MADKKPPEDDLSNLRRRVAAAPHQRQQQRRNQRHRQHRPFPCKPIADQHDHRQQGQQIGHQHPLYPTPYSQMHWWHTPLNSPGPHPVTYIVKIPWSQYEDYFSHPFVIARCQIPHNRQDIDRISFDVDMTGVAGFPNGYIIKVGFQFNDAHMGGY